MTRAQAIAEATRCKAHFPFRHVGIAHKPDDAESYMVLIGKTMARLHNAIRKGYNVELIERGTP